MMRVGSAVIRVSRASSSATASRCGNRANYQKGESYPPSESYSLPESYPRAESYPPAESYSPAESYALTDWQAAT
jgi:hypothetical protein